MFSLLPLPSITVQVYSAQSDVWSLGVTVWEMFSLGQLPHPALATPAQLLQSLRAGERLSEVRSSHGVTDINVYSYNTRSARRPDKSMH